ncbi:hypothetical protein HPB51_008904 [Rhipicephalus microplus]|uniref:Uncharacterized protein n=1 Tax=Rhipicephalus microplus TaxID=6941 RepID=A0A9J6ESP6_RHIMP|nr:hypothetical protein HPB51_008904 [Rhipicephalus microplus]
MSLNGFSSLSSALTVLPSCSHVTSLFLVLYEQLDGDTISVLVKYIAITTVLRNLEVNKMYISFSTEDRTKRTLMQALSINKSICKLSLEYVDLDDTEAQILVDKLQATRTLCELFLYSSTGESFISFLHKLSPIISSNYTLICLKIQRSIWPYEGAFAVSSAVSRNWSLVTRAAHFVMGMRHRYCASALELVHWNPAVVAKVQELASVDENEAVSRIQNSLKSFSELDDFMRMAGVVKWGVTCDTRRRLSAATYRPQSRLLATHTRVPDCERHLGCPHKTQPPKNHWAKSQLLKDQQAESQLLKNQPAKNRQSTKVTLIPKHKDPCKPRRDGKQCEQAK